jgi:hypothetical protein
LGLSIAGLSLSPDRSVASPLFDADGLDAAVVRPIEQPVRSQSAAVAARELSPACDSNSREPIEPAPPTTPSRSVPRARSPQPQQQFVASMSRALRVLRCLAVEDPTGTRIRQGFGRDAERYPQHEAMLKRVAAVVEPTVTMAPPTLRRPRPADLRTLVSRDLSTPVVGIPGFNAAREILGRRRLRIRRGNRGANTRVST